jgi:hypothetical protein
VQLNMCGVVEITYHEVVRMNYPLDPLALSPSRTRLTVVGGAPGTCVLPLYLLFRQQYIRLEGEKSNWQEAMYVCVNISLIILTYHVRFHAMSLSQKLLAHADDIVSHQLLHVIAVSLRPGAPPSDGT